MFERTELAKRKHDIKDEISLPTFGEVVEVYEHTIPEDGNAASEEEVRRQNSNFEADVILQNEKQLDAVPITTSIPGSIVVPRSSREYIDGDLVLVEFIEGDGEYPIITDVVYNDEDRAPLGREGMYRMKRGRLYEDVHPNDEYMRYAYKEEDDEQAQLAFGLYDTDPHGSLDDEIPQLRVQQNMAQYPLLGGEMHWSEYLEESPSDPYVLGRFRLYEDEMFIVNRMEFSDEDGLAPIEDTQIYLYDIDEEEELWSFWEQEPGIEAEEGWPMPDEEIPIQIDMRYDNEDYEDRRTGEPLYMLRWDDEFEGDDGPKNLEVHIDGSTEKLSVSMTCAKGEYDPDVEDYPEREEEYILR